MNPVARVEVYSEVDRIASEWRELERLGTATPYQRLAWFKAWIQTAGTARRESPLLVTAYDDDGQVTLLLPLVVRSRLGLTVASFAGGKHANFNMPLLRLGLSLSEVQVERLLGELSRVRPDVDLLVLGAMPGAWEGVSNPMIGPSTRPHPASALLVPFSSAAGLPGLLPQQRKLRWRDRRFSEHGKVAIRRAVSVDEVSRILDVFATHKVAWFESRKIANPFQASRILEFFKVLASHSNSGFEIRYLAVDDTIVAVVGVILGRTRASLMFVSYDPTSPLAALSPGIRLIQDTMADAALRNYVEFDFGLGEAGYKIRFGGQVESIAVLIRPMTARGYFAAIVVEYGRAFKIAVKQRPWLVQSLHQFRSYVVCRAFQLGR